MALNKKHNRLLSIFIATTEVMQDSILWLDNNGNILAVNEKFANQLGYPVLEFENKSIFQIDPTTTLLNWRKTWKKMLETGQHTFSTQHMNAKGEIYPVKIKGVLMEIGGDQVCFGVVDDLKASSKYKNLLHLASNISKVGAWEYQLEDNSFFATEQVNIVLGIPRSEEFTTDLLREVTPTLLGGNSYKELKNEILGMVVEKGQMLEKEIDVKPLDKSDFIRIKFLVQPSVEDDKIVGLQGTIQDLSGISARTDEMYLTQSCMEQAQDPICWIDEENNFTHINDSFCSFFGYKRKELLDNNISKVVANKKEQQHELDNFWQELKEKSVLNYEWEWVTKDGNLIPMAIRAYLVQYQGNYVANIFTRDLREVRETERSLRKAFLEISQLKDMLEYENSILKEEIDDDNKFNEIVSRDPQYKKVLSQINQVANTDATVLILGETGTGKELLARAVHRLSNRADKPMIKINCGALPPNLIESELFGHEKGSFTGAHQKKIGRFEAADQATIFLDEIGELPLDLQTKLLRVLQEGEFERVGGNDTISVDARVIAATNRNLEQRVAEGSFREDLFYRLNVFPIHNLALRERKEDILPLVQYFTRKNALRLGKEISEISQGTIKLLMDYDFPGNIRELENLVERACILSTNGKLRIDPSFLRAKDANKNNSDNDNFRTLEEVQRDHIIEAIRRCNGQISGPTGAAELLKINDKTLYSRMKKLKIEKKTVIASLSGNKQISNKNLKN